MIQTLIFDLSEVLIAGLVGIEKPLSRRLGIPEESILPVFGGDLLQNLCCGQISEQAYLEQILQEQGWDIQIDALKHIIRYNFSNRVEGMDALLASLAADYELVLLSDHATEWIAHIQAVHPFLGQFTQCFFSFELKQTKRQPSTFQVVLQAIQRQPEECLFVDDSLLNVDAARQAGLQGIVFKDAGQLAQELAALGIWKKED